MKWWTWTERIFITIGSVVIVVGLFLSLLGGVDVTTTKLGGELSFQKYENISRALLASGSLLLLSGICILSAIPSVKKNSPD